MKVNVVTVLYAPAIGKPEMVQGIRTKLEAERWGEKHGYATVYWLKSRERAYADRFSKRVNEIAEEIQRKSIHILKNAESGQGMVEFLAWLALVVAILICAMQGKPW